MQRGLIPYSILFIEFWFYVTHMTSCLRLVRVTSIQIYIHEYILYASFKFFRVSAYQQAKSHKSIAVREDPEYKILSVKIYSFEFFQLKRLNFS